jgi:hypothetical protein
VIPCAVNNAPDSNTAEFNEDLDVRQEVLLPESPHFTGFVGPIRG